ncbi:hypothetical protein CSOJ01_05880 [Colletotrichum sojae]|uniref:Uncharacterized protein n=1 Tax=Colletotrichum sojae TaxID=2175907 RepID=A0A8H6MWW2_9PEZI|nr:hypothetical protein CSOJ01_05880 [Colletotrichum sojae]
MPASGARRPGIPRWFLPRHSTGPKLAGAAETGRDDFFLASSASPLNEKPPGFRENEGKPRGHRPRTAASRNGTTALRKTHLYRMGKQTSRRTHTRFAAIHPATHLRDIIRTANNGRQECVWGGGRRKEGGHLAGQAGWAGLLLRFLAVRTEKETDVRIPPQLLLVACSLCFFHRPKLSPAPRQKKTTEGSRGEANSGNDNGGGGEGIEASLLPAKQESRRTAEGGPRGEKVPARTPYVGGFTRASHGVPVPCKLVGVLVLGTAAGGAYTTLEGWTWAGWVVVAALPRGWAGNKRRLPDVVIVCLARGVVGFCKACLAGLQKLWNGVASPPSAIQEFNTKKREFEPDDNPSSIWKGNRRPPSAGRVLRPEKPRHGNRNRNP